VSSNVRGRRAGPQRKLSKIVRKQRDQAYKEIKRLRKRNDQLKQLVQESYLKPTHDELLELQVQATAIRSSMLDTTIDTIRSYAFKSMMLMSAFVLSAAAVSTIV